MPDSPQFASEMARHLQALREGIHCSDDLFRLLAMELSDGRAALVIVAHHLPIEPSATPGNAGRNGAPFLAAPQHHRADAGLRIFL